ncbi:MAG: LysR family transcriptional regulator [Oscillospiraceae bacterium]|nr:LysR family transcriptional regulator [Oscillospiraceae bacterium]
MELRVLRYFLAAAREGSITRAASQLHVSQPTMSRQIKELEQELGVKLFVRTNYSVKLTEEGRKLARRAEDIVDLADKAAAELKAREEVPHGDVFIGATREESMISVADCFAEILEDCPDIRMNTYSGPLPDVLERLDSGVLDFAQTSDFPEIEKYAHFPLNMKNTWGLVMRRDDPLSRRASFTVEELCTIPLICSRKWIDQGFPEWIERVSGRLRIVAAMNMAYHAGVLVRSGIGCAVTVDKLADVGGSDLCFRPIEGAPAQDMHLVYRKKAALSPQARLFVEKLREKAE